ncbi:MAG: hypothetical protein IT477_10630 [Rhodanobacteraceae bacterium]|nr:hypothetical protein [Rhodanobacteraceae bacterium]
MPRTILSLLVAVLVLFVWVPEARSASPRQALEPPSAEEMVENALAVMVKWVPPERWQNHPLPAARETPDAARARYRTIAQAMVDTVLDPTEEPLYGGAWGRVRTLSVLLSIALHESSFRRDVFLGTFRGDGGRSWCLLQLNLGTGRVPDPDPVVGSWKGSDLAADPKKCIRAGLRVARRSFRACSALHEDNRLNAYASGRCTMGHVSSQRRMSTARRAFGRMRDLTAQKQAPAVPPVSPASFTVPSVRPSEPKAP